MKIPLTKYGMPQVAFFPVLILTTMAFVAILAVKLPVLWLIEAVLLIVLIWVLSFFRDPVRIIPQGANLLLSPADGTISDIEQVDEADYIGGKAKRIGIFLSVFNVHINRVPCDVKIDKITYQPGKFINAMNSDSSKVNEANVLAMQRLAEPKDKLVVRQISGAIARRIVCAAKVGDEFVGGSQFGMIKFGSRTELYIPADSNVKICVKKGDKVKAGTTVLARYE